MIRIASGIKQIELASELSIPASLLSMYEKGTREPTLTFIVKFTRYFEMSLSQFFLPLEKSPQNQEDLLSLTTKIKDLVLNLEEEALRKRT
jgi:transcriptional regulator with XRE-family HTH domain